MTAGRVLITGATGFVGRALVPHLARHEKPLTLALRKPVAPGPEAGDARHVTVGEVGPDTDWREALAGVGAVVHLAGLAHVPARESASDPYDRVNRAGSIRLYEAAAEAGAALFVFVSSATVLGDGTTRGRPFDDASPPNPGNAYARSKLAAEAALRARALAGGPALVILRPPLVCGPGAKGNLAALLRLLDTPLPLPLDGIANRRTLVPLDGLVAAIASVLADGGRAAGTYLVGARDPVSTTEIAALLRQGLGRPRRLVRAPARLIGAAARLVGREGIHRRLFGDFEIDAAGFGRAFALGDAGDVRASLVATGRAWQTERPAAPIIAGATP